MIRRWLLYAVCGVIAASAMLAPVSHAIKLTDCQTLGIDNIACENNLSSDKGRKNVAGQAIRVAIQALASISILIIVIAGFQMALSQGDQTKVKKARQAIIYAVAGLLVALFATVIVSYVIDNVKQGV
jgi:hypothetical protein